MKDLAEKLGGIEVSGMSIAQKAAIVKEIMDYLKITGEQVEEYKTRGVAKGEPLPSEDNQKEELLNLTSVVGEVAAIAQEEAKVTSIEIEPINFTNLASQDLSFSNETLSNTFEAAAFVGLSNKNDDSSNCSRSNIEQPLATEPQIQQFVIPVILNRLNAFGTQDKKSQSIVYQTQEYAANLKLEKDTQILSLNRIYPELSENQEALLASKENNSYSYSIAVNNLTQEEFERFKALFLEQQTRREQSQQTV